MANFKISNEVYNKLKKSGQEKANELANDAENKLIDKYISLLDWYYLDYQPKLDENGVPYYIRTFNLYNSFSPYKRTPSSGRSTYYGGIRINADKIKDYDSIRNDGKFSASNLLNKFIYNEDGTWHGGDWHGGYGVSNSFNIYKELHDYRDKLIDKYKKSCSIK